MDLPTDILHLILQARQQFLDIFSQEYLGNLLASVKAITTQMIGCTDGHIFGLLVAIIVGLVIARLTTNRTRHRPLKKTTAPLNTDLVHSEESQLEASPSETAPVDSVQLESDLNKSDAYVPDRDETEQNPDIITRICKEVCHLPEVQHDRKLSNILTETILSFKSITLEELPDRTAEVSRLTERHEKMEYVIQQSIKEIDFLNQEILRLTSDLQGLETARDENANLKQVCKELQAEQASNYRMARCSANNSEAVRNLEFQLLYGNTEKDDLIATLQKQLSEKDEVIKSKLERSLDQQDESINKWLFDSNDAEFAL